MYKIFSIIFLFICIILITIIISTPSKNNIIGASINTDNTIITSKFFKNTLNSIIIIFAILFYSVALILNLIHNNKINKLYNQKYIKIFKNK